MGTDARRTPTQAWPGLAPSRGAVAGADELASESVRAFLVDRPRTRLGLVAAGSGAEALTVAGWFGPCNYDNDTAKISAVLGDWEDRFGARVVAVGFAALHLSVAAPPVSERDALLVAESTSPSARTLFVRVRNRRSLRSRRSC
ncbi:DUF4253 domain-containing protein [Streptomyces sp. NBC_00347]|uniref:DUF4253 domain-containing protein n=1 Tax=Streptomyces sp. NBC_00347 TaxID=2975721 RepID=UPI00225BAD92|nr:DUF4253 domain-containing protein [Streptomyces sp. NBC_00347]MCX5124761.1 DUF4253 domain-containing protein [Streptomyces sp. NBC_00347]